MCPGLRVGTAFEGPVDQEIPGHQYGRDHKKSGEHTIDQGSGEPDAPGKEQQQYIGAETGGGRYGPAPRPSHQEAD